MNAYYEEFAVLKKTGSAGKCCIDKNDAWYVCVGMRMVWISAVQQEIKAIVHSVE